MKQNAGILFHGGPMEIIARSAYDRDGRRKYLTKAEGQKFLASVLQLPNSTATFCLILFYTGCRISEALSLRRCDFEPEMKTVMIRSLKKRARREIRRVPIPDFLAEELLKVTDRQSDDLIWSFSRTTGWRIIKGVMKKSGIFGIHGTTKGLRHGFGVRGALSQIPLPMIQLWMGHADQKTTAIYLAVQDDEERALMAKTW